jgi:AraC family L-rhamnose operon regulatory protein RhaS
MVRFFSRLHIGQELVMLSGKHPIRIHANLAQPDYPPHDHEFAEICIVLSGTARHQTENGTRPIEAGSMIVVMPGQVHAFVETRRLRITNVYYLSEWMTGNFRDFSDGGSVFALFFYESIFRKPAWSQIPQYSLKPEELDTALRDLKELQDELGNSEPSQFFLRATFSRFLYRAAKAFDHSAGLPKWQLPQDVRALLDGMEDALSRRAGFSLPEILRDIRLSERHASRRFRAAVGTGIWEYYQRRRIQIACRLLLDADRSITEIAHEMGFADGAHFSRSFRTAKGLSPREYRKVLVH